MKHSFKIIAIILIFASCKPHVYNNSNNDAGSSKIKSVDTSTIPSNKDSTGKMSNTFRDSSQPKVKK